MLSLDAIYFAYLLLGEIKFSFLLSETPQTSRKIPNLSAGAGRKGETGKENSRPAIVFPKSSTRTLTITDDAFETNLSRQESPPWLINLHYTASGCIHCQLDS